MSYQVVTAWSMKMSVIWDVAPCSLAEIDLAFKGVYYVHYQGDRSLNLGQFLPDYTRQHPIR
jgi:hypothetical protein